MKAMTLRLVVECFGFALVSLPLSADTTGAIQGTVFDAAAQTPVANAVVIASSSSLQGEQTALTDETGHFRISLLPVGSYTLHVQHDGYEPFTHDAALAVRLDQTIEVKLALLPRVLSAGEVVIVATRPVIDMGSAQAGAVVGQEQMQLVPYGRTLRNFDAVATSVPGVSADRYGVSMRGSGSPEGHYVIDGVDVTDPAYGLLGTTLLQDFVQEVDVKTGGFQAEYGRSSGGVINVVTKSGGNEVHGSVFFNWSPFELPRKEVLARNTPIAVQEVQRYSLDAGAEVGGPILRDRLWFFAGVAPQLNSLYEDRLIQALQDDGSARPLSASDGTPVFREIARKRYTQTTRTLQFAGKLTWLLSENHSLALGAYGNPTAKSGALGNMRGNEGTFLYRQDVGSIDVSLRYAGKVFAKSMLIEATAGYYRQGGRNGAEPIAVGPVSAATLRDTPGVFWNGNRNMLDPIFQDATLPDYQRDLAACQIQANGFDPCPVAGYATGGLGNLFDETLDRFTAEAKLTNFFALAGHHQLKYGVDYAIDNYLQFHSLSGNEIARERPEQGDFLVQQLGFEDPFQRGQPQADPNHPGHYVGERVQTLVRNRSLAFFVQDTWSILDRVVLDAGVRGEKQMMYGDPSSIDAQGNRFQGPQLQLFNLMPRLGILYDFSGRGLSKVYGSVGRFYEFVPLDGANRALSGGALFLFFVDPANCVASSGGVLVRDPRNCAVLPGANGRSYKFFGGPGAIAPVDPNLQGQYVDEVQGGAQAQLYRDFVFAADYVHRSIGRVIEDM